MYNVSDVLTMTDCSRINRLSKRVINSAVHSGCFLRSLVSFAILILTLSNFVYVNNGHTFDSTVPPKITPFTFGDEPMSFGEPVSVSCTISGGDLPIDVIWTHNRAPIEPSIGVLMEKRGKRIYTLMIESVQAKDAGLYSCKAQNQAGTVEHSSELIVQCMIIDERIHFTFECLDLSVLICSRFSSFSPSTLFFPTFSFITKNPSIQIR